MKILLLSSFYPPVGRGGAEKAASLLAQALVQAGHQVSVITFHPQSDETVELCDGVRVHRIPLDNFYFPLGSTDRKPAWMRLLWHLRDSWNWNAAARVGRILDLEQPDVVHSHVLAGFSVAVWREVRRRKIRLVHTLHDYYMLCVRSSMFSDGQVCAQRCTGCKLITGARKATSHQVDALVSVSGHVLDQHRRFGYFDGVPGSVIFNVLDVPPSPTSPLSLPPPAGLVFGFIGKLEEPKGIGLLLAATARMKRQDWRLRIAGSGLDAYANDLKAQFPDPRIEWLGFTSPADFYRSIDVAVVPSIWGDPLPYVTIEALFAGRSLICARSGGIPQIAALGRVVSLFPAGDVAALAERMDDALATPGPWRGGGFLDPRSADLFAAPVVADEYLKTYVASGSA